ncbi:MAG: serine--tRNA ligase [Candidatus Omnitrophota bacterium]|nr:MAG: serine--tRNA ligase [Candidatus Omnitrophota bacterium]HDN86380.1 serine--tRNA ligase [Candidatus Omnitrophota bacterium]
MLDVKFIRENTELVKQALKNRGYDFDLDAFLQLDEKRRDLIKKIENIRFQKNKANEEIKALLKEKKDVSSQIQVTKRLSQELDTLEEEFKKVKQEFNWQVLNIPNIPHSSIPVGDASANKIVFTKGRVRKFNFKPLTHIELGEHLGIFDFKKAAKICGSNFILFEGEGAKLERALINFMLNLHTKEHGYKEVFPPFLVNRTSMTTTGQLPKLEEDMYRLRDDDYFLIPTAEVPVTNIYREDILEEKELPIYYVSYTACFRREAGSYGKETKGLVRVHQFDKVELVKFTTPQSSYQELEKLLGDACRVIELLELPYRVILLATAELSFAATKCYDIEVYAPGIQQWLEVSSCSNFEDFQARRGNIRYREAGSGKLRFVHTLNGSGVALARLVIAILENYQQKDGSVVIPKVLRKYLDGRKKLTK